MMTLAVAILVAMLQQQEQPPKDPQQEPKPVPKDSVEVVATGCLKGKAFAAVAPREEQIHGPNVTGRTFRLNGPKDVMKDVKANDGHLVEVVGLVRKRDLQTQGISGKLGGMRVGIGAPSGTAPMGGGPVTAPDPASGVIIMDISSLRPVADTCNFPGR
jgi:hypothetical protein